MKSSITLLILAYNEEKNLENAVKAYYKVIKGLFEDYEILICNDGSSDNTEKIANRLAKENPHIRVFSSDRNRGMGYVYKKGVQLSRKQYSMWVPGDDEVTVESIKRMLQNIGKADLVISYIQNTNVRPLYRQVVSSAFIKVMNIIFGLKLKYFLGMILCRNSILRKLEFKTDSGCVMAEIIIQLVKSGCTYKEVPIILHRKEMSMNIFRPKNAMGIIKTVMNLFLKLRLKRSKI